MSTPMPRAGTWARIWRPSLLAAAMAARMCRWPTPARPCESDTDSGRCDARIISSSVSISVSNSGKSETTCSTPGADLAQSAGDTHKLLPGGGQGGCRLTPAGSVVERARGREAQGAGAHPFGGEAAHLDDLVGRRRFTIGTPLAHDEQPQRPMADLGGDVDVVRAAFDGVEVLGDAAPVPGQALVERSTRDVLDTFHQLDQLGVVGGADGSEADAAIPHHDRGHAVADDGWMRESQVTWPS